MNFGKAAEVIDLRARPFDLKSKTMAEDGAPPIMAGLCRFPFGHPWRTHQKKKRTNQQRTSPS